MDNDIQTPMPPLPSSDGSLPQPPVVPETGPSQAVPLSPPISANPSPVFTQPTPSPTQDIVPSASVPTPSLVPQFTAQSSGDAVPAPAPGPLLPTPPQSIQPTVGSFDGSDPATTLHPLFQPPAQPANQSFSASQMGKKKSSKLMKLVLVIVLLLVVVGGGAAAAYEKVILPNQPQGKLLAAFANAAGQKQITVKGTVDVQEKNATSAIKGYSANFTLAGDLTNNNVGLSGTLGVGGTQFTYDLRYVSKSIYVKLGGLSFLNKIAPLSNNPGVTPYLKALSSIDNQWYVLDRSFLQESSVSSCVSNVSFALTKSDVGILKTAYKKDPPFSVKSSSASTIDGTAVIKMQLNPASDATIKSFGDQLNGLSVVKNINKCISPSGSSKGTDSALNTPASSSYSSVYAYITSSKQLKAIEIDGGDSTSTDKFTTDFSYNQTNITAPTGAKPVQDLISLLVAPSLSIAGKTTPSPLPSILQ